jgi:hypothetical protein
VAALLREILEVCLLRRGPQDLPYSPPAVLASGVALVALQLAFATYHEVAPGALAARALVTVLMVFGATVTLLRLRNLANRTAQTLLAVTGIEVLFALVTMPMLMVVQPHLGSENPPGSALVVMLAAVFAFFWKLRVNAAIWRQALEIPMSAAYLLTLLWLLCEALLLFAFVPAPVPAAP